jgi:CheY-like chemotaxis protein
VSDTGIGLEAASIERIFAMFSQVDSVIDRSEGGLGIGLALVRGLVELHGGSVSAQSEGLGRGSRFVLQLPGITERAAAPVKPTQPPSQPGKGWRIVIADDNRDAATSLAMLLELAGHEVRLANDGAEALAIIEAFQPHAAFIDIGMPLLNGYDVARRVRRHAWGADMRLIAVSGWGQDHNKRQAHQAGFDHHLTKPFEPSQPELLLQQLLGATETADSPAIRS